MLELGVVRGALDEVSDEPVAVVEESHGAEVEESAVININGVLLHRVCKSCCFLNPDEVKVLLQANVVKYRPMILIVVDVEVLGNVFSAHSNLTINIIVHIESIRFAV